MAVGTILKAASAAAKIKDENGSSMLSKIIIFSVIAFVLILAIVAFLFDGVLGSIIGIFLYIFEPFTDKYQKEGVYNQIANYGGAYKTLNIEGLTNAGMSTDVIKYLFYTEHISYDTEASTITVPYISEDTYLTWEASEDKATTDGDIVANTKNEYASQIDVLWDLSDETYQYRTHWEYIVALSTAKMMKDGGADLGKMMEEVAGNIDENGNIKDSGKIKFPITQKAIDNVCLSLEENGMWTDIRYFTNYVSDFSAQFESADDAGGDYYGGDFSKSRVESGYSFTNYCQGVYRKDISKASLRNENAYNNRGINESMRFSSLPRFLGKYYCGDKPGEYAFITNDGYLYPVLVVCEASNWLCRYSELDYVKVKDKYGDTHYVLSTYKKTYRIGDMLKQWEAYGLSEGDYQTVQTLLRKLQEGIGGTLADELEKAYSYYKKYGKELSIVYSNPTYAPKVNEGDEVIDNVYGIELSTPSTDAEALSNELKALHTQQTGKDGFKVGVTMGLNVARTLYKYSMCYQPASINHNAAGYHSNNFSDSNTYSPYKAWGTLAYDKGDAGTADKEKNARIGLCSSGFIAYCLRYSVFGDDYTYLSNTPSISEIYEKSDYRFRNVSELRPGDIALLNYDAGNLNDTNSDEKNVIAYYLGEENGNHLFFAMNPSGSFGSAGVVRKVCLATDVGGVDVVGCDLKYFCRYYKGYKGNVVQEYTTGTGKTEYDKYCVVKNALDIFAGDVSGKKHINNQPAFVSAVLANPVAYGCVNYADANFLRHLSGGIMTGGVGDDAAYNLDKLDTKGAIYEPNFFMFPIELDKYTEILQWYSWYDRNGDGKGTDYDGYESWNSGIEIAAPCGIPVLAAADGRIEFVKSDYSDDDYEDGEDITDEPGNYIRIVHVDNVVTEYQHLSSVARGIKANVQVKKGQVIGYVGYSGDARVSQLHFEIRDSKEHSGYEGMPFGTARNKRPSSDTRTLDPYMFFPSLAGSKRVNDKIYNARPMWFDADKSVEPKDKK